MDRCHRCRRWVAEIARDGRILKLNRNVIVQRRATPALLRMAEELGVLRLGGAMQPTPDRPPDARLPAPSFDNILSDEHWTINLKCSCGSYRRFGAGPVDSWKSGPKLTKEERAARLAEYRQSHTFFLNCLQRFDDDKKPSPDLVELLEAHYGDAVDAELRRFPDYLLGGKWRKEGQMRKKEK